MPKIPKLLPVTEVPEIRKGDYVRLLGEWALVINDPSTAEREMIQLGERIPAYLAQEMIADPACAAEFWVMDEKCREGVTWSTDGATHKATDEECGRPGRHVIDFDGKGLGDGPYVVCEKCAKFYSTEVGGTGRFKA